MNIVIDKKSPVKRVYKVVIHMVHLEIKTMCAEEEQQLQTRAILSIVVCK